MKFFQERDTNRDALVLSFLNMRKVVGFLAFIFPFVLMIGSRIFSSCGFTLDSISHYYYSAMGDVFVGIIIAIALFLMAYPGYDKVDNRITSAAGLCAIGLTLFPTSPISGEGADCAMRILDDVWLRKIAHYVFAAIFFVLLSVLSIFRFTKGSDSPSAEKKMRNKIYLICGIVMILSILLILLFWKLDIWRTATFWLEVVALMAFGISWMVKGEAIYGDRKAV